METPLFDRYPALRPKTMGQRFIRWFVLLTFFGGVIVIFASRFTGRAYPKLGLVGILLFGTSIAVGFIARALRKKRDPEFAAAAEKFHAEAKASYRK